MPDVEFKDNRVAVNKALDSAISAFLNETAGEIVSQTARNTPVDTGQLKGSWTYAVDETSGSATIGSPLENAIWNEFGTGEYAFNGNGRKGGWTYQDAKGEYHYTYGKKPQRTFQTAFNVVKPKAIKKAESIFKTKLS